MKIERKAEKGDQAGVFYVDQSEDQVPPSSKIKGRIRRLVPYIITAVLFSSLTFGAVKYFTPPHLGLKYVIQATSGKVALTASQLQDVINSEGLTVYWLGPMEGALYALNSVSQDQNYVRYLPNGEGLNDPAANYRVIGTYEAKDAFALTQVDAKSVNGVGFINADGNAVFYNSLRPNSVYIGVKGTDDQIEIFDPNSGLALIAAKSPGLLSKISWGGLRFVTGCRVFSTCYDK